MSLRLRAGWILFGFNFVLTATQLWADPVLGKSGLISTMVKADGLIEIDINTEGLDKGTKW